jgi:hypothetical protein
MMGWKKKGQTPSTVQMYNIFGLKAREIWANVQMLSTSIVGVVRMNIRE